MKLSSLFSPSSKLMKALQNKDYDRRKHATIELERLVQGSIVLLKLLTVRHKRGQRDSDATSSASIPGTCG